MSAETRTVIIEDFQDIPQFMQENCHKIQLLPDLPSSILGRATDYADGGFL
jgi:hypothetical protein